MIIVYPEPGPVGSFIEDFMLLMNELPIQHRILTVGDFSLNQMLPENVANIAPLIQNCRSIHSIQLTYTGEYWILHLLPRIPILLQLYLHPTAIILFIFSKSEARYDLNLHCQHYPHKPDHYYNYGPFKCLVEIELAKNSENLK